MAKGQTVKKTSVQTLTLGAVIDGYTVINKHSSENINDMVTAIKIAMFMRKAQPFYDEWNKAVQALWKKYGVEREHEDGSKVLVIPPDKKTDFEKEMTSINSMATDIGPMLDIEDFSGFKNGSIIEANALAAITKS